MAGYLSIIWMIDNFCSLEGKPLKIQYNKIRIKNLLVNLNNQTGHIYCKCVFSIFEQIVSLVQWQPILHNSSTVLTRRAQRFPVVMLLGRQKHTWTPYLWFVHKQQLLLIIIHFIHSNLSKYRRILYTRWTKKSENRNIKKVKIWFEVI